MMVVVEVTVVVVVMVGRFVKVWVEELLHCRASCKHLSMTALLPPVTRCRDKRCRHRILVGKWADYTIKPWNASVRQSLQGGTYGQNYSASVESQDH